MSLQQQTILLNKEQEQTVLKLHRHFSGDVEMYSNYSHIVTILTLYSKMYRGRKYADTNLVQVSGTYFLILRREFDCFALMFAKCM